MTNKEVSAEFISAHLNGPTGDQLTAQWIDAYNGQQRVTGLNQFVESAPSVSVADIMAVTALLGKDAMAQARPAAAPRPQLH